MLCGMRMFGAEDILKISAIQATVFVSLPLRMTGPNANTRRQRDLLEFTAFARDATAGETVMLPFFALTGLSSLGFALRSLPIRANG
jgi:hypothetical protein